MNFFRRFCYRSSVAALCSIRSTGIGDFVYLGRGVYSAPLTNKTMKLTPRLCNLTGFLACLGLLLTAAYFQFVEELEPCPLCISQRIAILAVGIVFLAAAIHNPGRTGTRVYAVATACVALIGAGISARHVWLQNLPPAEVPECSPGLEYIFNNFPLSETVKLLLNGTGECAEVLWTFLGLSIPAWTLVAFVFLGGWSLAQFWSGRGLAPLKKGS